MEYYFSEVCDTEIITFVVNGSLKLTILQEYIQVRRRNIALFRVVDLQFNSIYLTMVILKLWVA